MRAAARKRLVANGEADMKKNGKRLDKEASPSAAGGFFGIVRSIGSGICTLWKGKKVFRVICMVLAVFFALGMAGLITWSVYVRLPDSDSDLAPDFDEFDDDPLYINPDDDDDDEPQVIVTPPSATPRPTPSPLVPREDIYTVLLAGVDDDGNTDTIMVATLDRKEGTLGVMSIPRDTTTLRNGVMVKINSIYGRGGSGDRGMEALRQEVSTLVGFKPNSHAMLDWKGFKKLVNTIGGVEFTIPFDMIHLDKDDSKSIRLKKGTYTLYGDQALQLMRFRTSDPYSGGKSYDDYGRMETQQKFILAVIKKMLKLNNWNKISEYVNIASTSVKPTNLDLGNMLGFATEIMKIDTDKISFSTLPTITSGYGYYENVIEEEALKKINETINPYSADITMDYVEWPQHD